jgi:hypothetical protein
MHLQTDCLEKYYLSLDAVNGIYSTLYAMVSKERDLIMREDVRSLAELILEKEELMGRLSEIREHAAECLLNYKQSLGYGSEEVPMARLLPLMPDEWKYRFEKLVGSLRNYSAGIRTMSTINRKLVSDTMKFINFVIDFMKKSDGEMETYSTRGTVSKKSNERSFLDISL